MILIQFFIRKWRHADNKIPLVGRNFLKNLENFPLSTNLFFFYFSDASMRIRLGEENRQVLLYGLLMVWEKNFNVSTNWKWSFFMQFIIMNLIYIPPPFERIFSVCYLWKYRFQSLKTIGKMRQYYLIFGVQILYENYLKNNKTGHYIYI